MSMLAAILAALVSPQIGAPQSAPACEFHVWPGSKAGSAYYGWAHGGIANAAVDGRKNYPRVPSNPMSTDDQAELLRASAPQVLLAHPTDTLVLHADALDSRTIRTTPGRIAGETAACYAELIVDDVTLRQDLVNGSWLMVLFRYRDFGHGLVPARVFSTWVKARLPHLPTAGAFDETAARADFRGAFRQDVVLFAAAALKPAKPKH